MEVNLDKVGDLWLGFTVSLGAVAAYAVMRAGFLKSWYILVPLPGRLGPAMFYALPAFGLAFTTLLLSAVFPVPDPARDNIWFTLFLILEGVGLFFMIWPPFWIKPRWVRWLEREYAYGLHILMEEARALGRWKWEVRVSSREKLESWVQEVMVKRSEDMYWAFRGWVDHYVIRNTTRMERKSPEKLGTLEQYMVPPHVYVPAHREKDYQEYLETERARILCRAIDSFASGHSFTASDLECICPGVSRETIRDVLNDARRWGNIRRTGRGRSAQWWRV